MKESNCSTFTFLFDWLKKWKPPLNINNPCQKQQFFSTNLVLESDTITAFVSWRDFYNWKVLVLPYLDRLAFILSVSSHFIRIHVYLFWERNWLNCLELFGIARNCWQLPEFGANLANCMIQIWGAELDYLFRKCFWLCSWSKSNRAWN